MVKRLFSIGAAIALILSFSVVSFASSSETVNLEFPYFGRARLVKGSTEIYVGTKGNDPITGVNVNVTDSTGAGASSIILQMYAGGNYNKSFTGSSYSMTYHVPGYSIKTGNGQSLQGAFSENTGTLIDPSAIDPGSYDADTTGWYYYSDGSMIIKASDTYGLDETVNISAGTGNVTVKNNVISSGDYVVIGHIDYANNSFTDVSEVLTGDVQVRLYAGNEYVIVNNPSFNFHKTPSSVDDMIEFAVPFSVGQSMEYTSIQIVLGSKSNFDKPIKGFGIGTGGFEYSDQVTSVSGLSFSLANWFSGLKSTLSSGFHNIASLITNRDNDASAAAESADHQAVTEANSEIASVESFETSTAESIDDSIGTIRDSGYLAAPSSSGITSSVGVIGYIFNTFYDALGSYKFVVIVPLVLGLVLLMVGRGGRALRGS